MKSFTVTKNDAGQRLDKFISKAVPMLPGGLMYKYIRIKRIKINGGRAQISTRLSEGDKVDMYINDEFFEKKFNDYDFMRASKELTVIYEDGNIMILDKKQGLLSHPDEGEYNDTLITRVKRYLYEKGEYDPEDENSFSPALVNRIDRNTRGIVIAAKTAEALRILNEKMKKRELHKLYLCVVHGVPDKGKIQPDGSYLMEDWLVKNEQKNMVKIYKKQVENSKDIRTKYRVLKVNEKDGLSLVEVELLTGRTHQIRAHFAYVGCPLLGDGKYGSNELNKKKGYKKQCLCSYKLTFDFTSDAGELEYLNGKSFAIDDVWFEREFDRI